MNEIEKLQELLENTIKEANEKGYAVLVSILDPESGYRYEEARPEDILVTKYDREPFAA
jgi:uncharacterized protein GlcG (DUF336 family)